MNYGCSRFDFSRSFVAVLQTKPHAIASVYGSPSHASIAGSVRFYQIDIGVLVAAEIGGLPEGRGACQDSFFGFHIHGGKRCDGSLKDPFADALTHYNPKGCPHPHHAGDMPPLLSSHGYGFLVFVTDRFSVNEIVGKTVVIHSMPDDFTSQPAGNAGEKMACGEVQRCMSPILPRVRY